MNKRDEVNTCDKSDGATVPAQPLQGFKGRLSQAHAQELTRTIMNGPLTDALDAQLELIDFIGNDGFKGLILDLITCDLRVRNAPLRAYPDRLAKLFEIIVNDL